ncbi:tetratricopeptide repeat protein [Streptomyces sp. NPDC012935]|uniref:tetratricopeptide repeat protein n=1 Tax=Streptomyces sp. NPDC012935 TaxID=3364857 RepID=UPI0036C7E163
MAGRAGRPWGPIRAESAEANALADFLRAQVDASGKTLNGLAGEIPVSKTRISDYLGGKVPDQKFVSALIRATVPEPRLRERRMAEAGKLLRAAAHPSPVKPQPSATSALELAEARAQQVEIYDRLTRSLEQQNELREAAGNSAKLVMILLSMINGLERRITDLTSERDQLHAAHADAGALVQTQQQLTRAQEQEQRAQQELQRAQEKQRQAEELAARVQAQVEQLTDELDRLRTGATSATITGYDDPVPGTAHLATTDPVGDDIDEALARVVAVNDRDDQTLRRITHDLVEDVLTEEVVRNNTPDNPASSPSAADNLTALRAAAEAAAEGGDFREAIRLYTARLNASVHLQGPEHPDTLATRHMVAFWRGEAGDAAGAAKALAELLPVVTRVQGAEHPDTLTTRHNLASWRGRAGEVAGAAAALAELLPVREQVLGAEHPDTLTTRHDLATWRGQAGEVAGAAIALAELLPVREQVLGAEHPIPSSPGTTWPSGGGRQGK